MDPSRIESYLRSTCSVLDFDIGELWSARKLPGQSPELKFIQLYTSPTYEDFHALLIQPDSADGSKDEEMHRFSPIICRGVCDGGQIVWANTRISQGLTGRTELPLNTAVGVPICSIGHELFILVLFAVEIIAMTPASIEYLATVSRTVTENSITFLSPAFAPASSISQANTEDFVGIWDIGELVRKYSSEVEFHLLPIGKLQKYFDCNEILLFCDFFTDFKTRRDGRFTVKQLESLRESYKTRQRSDSITSVSSKTWDYGLITNSDNLTQTNASNSYFVKETAIPNSFSTDGTTGPGVFNADIGTVDNVGLTIDEPTHSSVASLTEQHEKLQPNAEFKVSEAQELVQSNVEESDSVLHIYAQMTYKASQCRFHEFMISVLGMTVFEGSELWLVSERESELFLVAGVYRNSNMQKWISFNENLRLSLNSSGPGRVVSAGSSIWDTNYSSLIDDNDPRKQASAQYNIQTCFGVPLHGLKGICGALMFYSTKKDFAAEPLLILLVERAVQLIAATNIESASFAMPTDENQPSTTLTRWLLEDAPQQQVNPQEALQPYDPMNQQLLHNPFSGVDYQQKLEMCRSIVNTNKDLDLPYPPSQDDDDEEPEAMFQGFGNPTFNSLGQFAQHMADYSQQNNIRIDTTDPETAAAFALANIGKVSWSKFLEGSNNGASFDSNNPGLKLDSNKLLGAIYGEKQPMMEGNSNQNLPKCKVDDCSNAVENISAQYCATHRNMRRCQKEGCNKCAQGATKYCIAHGGGRRCTFPGCYKGARDKFFCAAHGGGKRCTFDGCSKSAVGGSNLCTAHGGGKRCQFPGCSKSSQAGTKYCVRHGGGRTCSYPGCNKVARGKTEFCAAHGGGIRCRLKGCNRLAVNSHQLCRTHIQQQQAASGGKIDFGDIGDEGDDEDDDEGSFPENGTNNQSLDGTEEQANKRQKIT